MSLYGEKDITNGIDYTVVSVGIATLGLILVVELTRHQLDHAAHHKPFFKTVLDNVYSELATLGIVEFGVFLLQRYYEGLDKYRKEVFGDIHFALFYTAIFNAIQCIILAIVVSRQGRKLWVQTEDLELDRYVQLREKFDKLRLELFPNDGATDDIDKHTYGNEAAHARTWFTNHFKERRKWKKYKKLLTKIRFHQLRVHFLEGNNLPTTFRVSEYLMKCDRTVLIHLVHISALAWLLLTAALNLVYFLLGMVAYVSEDEYTVGTSMTSLFFGSIAFFIFTSLAIHLKMRSIFDTVIHKDPLRSRDNESMRNFGEQSQRELFWFGDPEIIISLVQFMAFCYALGLSIVIMYWKYIDDAALSPGWYLLALFLCYGLFLRVMANAIPQYTLCTSMGEMVNQRHLYETMGEHRLEIVKKEMFTTARKGSLDDTSKSDLSSVKKLTPSESHASLMSIASNVSDSSSARATKLSELVRLDTDSLRDHLPEESRRTLQKREQTKTFRKNLSDGVSAMRNGRSVDDIDVTATSADAVSTSSSSNASTDAARRRQDRRERRRRMSVSAPNVIKSWQDFSVAQDSIPEETDKKFEIGLTIEEEEEVPTAGSPQNQEQEQNPPPDESLIEDCPIIDPESVEKENKSGATEDSSTSSSIISFAEARSFLASIGHNLQPSSILRNLESYYRGGSFPLTSHIFGTCICFFLVGMRVETMLIATGVMKSSHFTWDMKLGASFWWEFGMLAVFLVNDALSAFLMQRKASRDTRTVKILTAAGLDVVIVLLCMIFLLVSESQRCCPDDQDREDFIGFPGGSSDCCGAFGSRTYSGLGRIEPFCSLIAIRVFRFTTAKFLMKRGYISYEGDQANSHDRAEHDSGHQGGHGHEHEHGGEDTGTALELWERAVKDYPDIVANHGELSAELFHAMLGIEPLQQAGPQEDHAGQHDETKDDHKHNH